MPGCTRSVTAWGKVVTPSNWLAITSTPRLCPSFPPAPVVERGREKETTLKRILVTGAVGQIGSELTLALRERYGGPAVVASDVKLPSDSNLLHGGPFEFVDCLDPHHITRVMQIHKIDTIFHLAALLSAVAEMRPLQAWQLNVNGVVNMLEAGRQYGCALFFPSSIGAFGPET